MKNYIKMVVFVLLMGAFSALLLIGVDVLTKDRISQNKLIELQSTILEHNGVLYTLDNVFELFESQVTPEEKEGLVLYRHNETNNVSFNIGGSGLWGPIKGILTLQEDFKTIVNVSILEQEETPGLGAFVGERVFLDRLVGKVFDPTINIVKGSDGTLPNEIDSITGATGTSSAFQIILNNAYKAYYTAFVGDDLFDSNVKVLKHLLELNNIEFTEENYKEVFNQNFQTDKLNDLTLYSNLNNGYVTIFGEKPMKFGQNGDQTEDVVLTVTLKRDFETIVRISAIFDENAGQWGKTILLDQENLDKAIGKKFPITFTKEESNEDNVLGDQTGATTHTLPTFNKALAEIAQAYEGFKGNLPAIEVPLDLDLVKENILKLSNITYEPANLDITFNNNFKTFEKFYMNNETQDVVYFNEFDFHFSPGGAVTEKVAVILILQKDLETVRGLTVLHDGNKDHWGKKNLLIDEVLNKAAGKKFNDLFTLIDEKYQFGDVTGVTHTTNSLRNALNDINLLIQEAKDRLPIFELTKEQKMMLHLLEVSGFSVKIEAEADIPNIETEFNKRFDKIISSDKVLYKDLNSGNVVIIGNKDLKFGRNGAVTESTLITLTLKSDFDTVVDFMVFSDGNTAHWGKRDLLKKDVLKDAIGKSVGIIFDRIDGKNVFNDVARVTYTTDTLLEAVTALMNEYIEFKDLNILSEKEIAAVNSNNNLESGTIEDNFTLEVLEGKTLYTEKESGNYTFVFTELMTVGNKGADKSLITFIVTLGSDFKTVVNISTVHDGYTRHWAKTRLLIDAKLGKARGKDITNLFVELDGKDQFEDVTGVTITTSEFKAKLQTNYEAFKTLFNKGGI
ncbi:FMN-binding protein [Haploplasma modicum]|uniref:FMN-binding protein n=1 Tax=Haploplasma modicum TaxID=2150 RepID=UPI00138AC793|nr:FMN-binding protein [Haploplasma modicum]